MDFRAIAATLVEDVFKQVQQDRCLNQENLLRITRQALAMFQADMMAHYADDQPRADEKLRAAATELLRALTFDKYIKQYSQRTADAVEVMNDALSKAGMRL